MHLPQLMRATLVALAVGALVPTMARAQSQIGGQVTDNTGAVLPGVTVEATSPVLIESSRVAITDGQGNYTLTDLRPGTYTLTFMLSGFGTQVRNEIELSSDITMTINVALTVGSVEERMFSVEERMLLDYVEWLRLRGRAGTALNFGQADNEQTPKIGGEGIIQLCEVGPDGTVSDCRRVFAAPKIFR